MSTILPFVHFSTKELPANLQFEAWREQPYAFEVSPAEDECPKSFAAEVDIYVFGSALMLRARQGAQQYAISPDRARKRGRNIFLFTCYERGEYRGCAGADEINGGAGDIQVLDLSQTMNTIETSSIMTGIAISHDALREKLGTLDKLHGLDLRRTTGAFLNDYFQLLARRLPTMSEQEAAVAAEATIDVIAACVRPTQERMLPIATQVQTVLVDRAEKAVERHLQEPQLSPEFLCKQLGVSRRTLYRVFEERGGVHNYILGRRLAAVAVGMIAPGETRSISELAELYGFTTSETFWRAFKRRYELTPGEFRAGGRVHHAGASSSAIVALFEQWNRGPSVQGLNG
ncbi:helix-turn-helix domain-containing protein [Mesorhizobium sp. DCY119]|uniref:helix-turn-helix domain-containing protein n=1 Tax=Mesorhizobium sp. DCY119 TaxID=2108445 RepID=UPI00140349C2|nr:helix-turn-helix domain-containing protein [Mesorhizobium sp. DCY119]